jgi:hypothetical protein
MHDGDAPLDDAVEQRGFPDIRAADDGDKILHWHSMPKFKPLRKSN